MRLMDSRKRFAGLRGSPRVWVMLGTACICTIGFFVVTSLVFGDAGDGKVGATAFDRRIAQFLYQFRSAALTGRVTEVSALGSAPVLLVLALLAYSVVVRARDWLGVLHLSTVLVGAGVLSRLLQHLFERARPEDLLPFIVVTKGSFPSAHLFGAAACYATFAFFYSRYASRLSTEIACHVLAFVLVLLIGVTRIYLGAHHATDVIAGIAAGGAWAFLVAAVFSLWYGERQNLS
jgi:membrane-associated phospholipid phosphatase